jgi:DNA end-binding protein Ku
MAATAWRGMLTFGLVSIPVRLYVAARAQRIYLHQIHRDCHTRLKQPLFCPHCNRFVDKSEVIKGYEYENGQYVLVEPEEIKKIMPASGKTMEILAFVKENEIDPIYFDSSFLCMPDAEGHKGYQLLLRALEDTHVVGIAKVTMHQREYTVFVRPRAHGITVHTMYYANEIASVEGYGKQPNVKMQPQEVKLAEQLVESLTAPFQPEQYHDDFQQRLRQLIEAKAHGQKVTLPAEQRRGRVIDIMQALKKSLAAQEAAKTAAQARPARRGRRAAAEPVPITAAAKAQRRKAS